MTHTADSRSRKPAATLAKIKGFVMKIQACMKKGVYEVAEFTADCSVMTEGALRFCIQFDFIEDNEVIGAEVTDESILLELKEEYGLVLVAAEQEYQATDYFNFELLGVKEYLCTETSVNRTVLAVGRDDASYYVLNAVALADGVERTLIRFENGMLPEDIENMLRMNEHVNSGLVCYY